MRAHGNVRFSFRFSNLTFRLDQYQNMRKTEEKRCIKRKSYFDGISSDFFPHIDRNNNNNENLPNYSLKWCEVDYIPVSFYIPVSD